MTNLQVRKLRAFGHLTWCEVERDLNLLRDIDTTIEALDVRYESLRQADVAADHFINLLRQPNTMLKNGEQNLVEIFEKARDSMAEAYAEWSAQHLCAVNAPELHDDDGVVEAYALVLTVTASLHDKLNTLCWMIGEYYADEDEVLPGRYSTARELFESMGV